MLPRGRPRAMGAVVLLLLLLVVGFFLFGRDPECERPSWAGEEGILVTDRCLLTPRVFSDGLGTTATLDEKPYGSRNRSASSSQLLLPSKCEVVVPSAATPKVPGPESSHLGICGNHGCT